jgi:hypothetical protein
MHCGQNVPTLRVDASLNIVAEVILGARGQVAVNAQALGAIVVELRSILLAQKLLSVRFVPGPQGCRSDHLLIRALDPGRRGSDQESGRKPHHDAGSIRLQLFAACAIRRQGPLRSNFSQPRVQRNCRLGAGWSPWETAAPSCRRSKPGRESRLRSPRHCFHCECGCIPRRIRLGLRHQTKIVWWTSVYFGVYVMCACIGNQKCRRNHQENQQPGRSNYYQTDLLFRSESTELGLLDVSLLRVVNAVGPSPVHEHCLDSSSPQRYQSVSPA